MACLVSPPMTPDEIVSQACPKIADLGGAFYFVPETTSRGKERGVDGMRLYFLGRGGVLGDTSAAVVRSAFGYFNPGLVEKLWNSGREKLPVDRGRRPVLERLRRLRPGQVRRPRRPRRRSSTRSARCNDAADPSGLALYAGIRQMPLSETPPAGRCS